MTTDPYAAAAASAARLAQLTGQPAHDAAVVLGSGWAAAADALAAAAADQPAPAAPDQPTPAAPDRPPPQPRTSRPTGSRPAPDWPRSPWPTSAASPSQRWPATCPQSAR